LKAEFKGSQGKMPGRLRTYFVWVLAIIVATIVLGPPLACASKLPTACNLFDQKELPKPGSCKYKIVSSDQRTLETEMAVGLPIELEEFKGLSLQSHQTSVSLIPFEDLFTLVPLRC
jgi:hypothetical protein